MGGVDHQGRSPGCCKVVNPSPFVSVDLSGAGAVCRLRGTFEVINYREENIRYFCTRTEHRNSQLDRVKERCSPFYGKVAWISITPIVGKR